MQWSGSAVQWECSAVGVQCSGSAVQWESIAVEVQCSSRVLSQVVLDAVFGSVRATRSLASLSRRP